MIGPETLAQDFTGAFPVVAPADDEPAQLPDPDDDDRGTADDSDSDDSDGRRHP